MEDRHPRRWTLLLWIICSATIAGTLLWCVLLLRSTSAHTYSSGDGALIELYTLYSSRGVWSLGPYSRFGWNHPGPLFFYCIVPFYLASLQNALALNVAALAINIVSLTTALWVTLRYAGAALGSVLVAGLAWYLWRTDVLLPSAWNPHIVLLPLVVLLVTSAVVASGRLSLLPVVIVAASFIAQTHVGLVPLAGTVTLLAAVGGVWQAVRGRLARSPRSSPRTQPPWIWVLLSTALGLLLWLPPLMEQVAPDGGNLGKIVRFFSTSDQADALPMRTTIATWATTWSAALRWDLTLPYGGRLKLRFDETTATSVGIAILCLGVFGSWAASRGRLVEAWCCRLSAVSSVLALIVIGRIRGGLADHLVPWVTIVGLLGVVSLTTVVCIWLSERVRVLRHKHRHHRGHGQWRAAAPAAALVLLIGSVWDGASQLESNRRHVQRRGVQITGDSAGDASVAVLYQALHRFMSETSVGKPLISPHGDSWAQTAGIVVQLYKHNIPVAMPASVLWMFGSRLAPRGDEDAELTIADSPSRARLSRRQGDCVVAEHDGISIHLLLPSSKSSSTTRICKAAASFE